MDLMISSGSNIFKNRHYRSNMLGISPIEFEIVVFTQVFVTTLAK